MNNDIFFYDSFHDSMQDYDYFMNQGSESLKKDFPYLQENNINCNNNPTFQGICNFQFFDNDKHDSLSNSEFLSKKRAISQNKKEFEQIKLAFDINIENKNIENSGNNLKQNKKSFTYYNIKNNNNIKITSKNIKKDFINSILDCFPTIKNLKAFLNTDWEIIILKYQLNKTFQLSYELLKTTPNDYIQKILVDLNKKKNKEKNELTNINFKETQKLINIIRAIITMIKDKKIIFNTNILDDLPTEKKSTTDDEINISIENILDTLIAKEEENKENKENKLIIEIYFENRKDNLFDRLKTMINDFFIYIFNTKVSKENKLPIIKYN